MAKNTARDTVTTLVVDNFGGTLTYKPFGNINSGLSDIRVSSGANPWLRPGSLTWGEQSIQINPNEDIITDLIMDGQERVENGILFVYCIGHTGRLYKIQVNDPTTYNPDYDNPVLLATLTVGSPTFTRGGFMTFFGATEKIYIGNDKGLTSINFDGTGEAAVSGSWTQNVPRPAKQFVGKLYIGNGSNIAEIDSTGTVTSSTKLSPGFPTNTQVRDLDYSTDGNYLEMVVSTLPLGDITTATQDTSITSSSNSYVFKWNGIDAGYTTFDYYPTFALDANITFQDYQYIFGRDQTGSAIYNPTKKFTEMPEAPMVLPNAIGSTGNLLTWISPLSFLDVMFAQMYVWGNWDWEIGNPIGYWGTCFALAKSPETDIVQVPFQRTVSGTGLGAASNGYPSGLFGTSKIYFSTLETSATPTIKYRLYKYRSITSPIIARDTPITPPPTLAIYQTQTQMFSKRMSVKEVRIYADPWIANNSFQIDLIGPDGNPIVGSTRVFDTADGTLNIGDDFCWYNPMCSPQYAIGLAFTNVGSSNYTINKTEIDITPAGE